MSTTIHAACVQHAMSTDRAANLDKSLAGIREAAASGAVLIVLPELHRGPYFCQEENKAHFELAEPLQGETFKALSAVARELEIVIVGSIFEHSDDGRYFNTALVIERDGTLAGRYHKTHIPYDPGYYEKFYFEDGPEPLAPIKTSVGMLGVMVCFDQWFPEAARIMALQGAEILIYPTAIGFDPRDDTAEQTRQQDSWITVQRSHAIANSLPVIACNRTGHEPDPSGASQGIRFWGASFIAGPQGEFLARAETDETVVLSSILDTARTDEVRKVWTFLRDRRPALYKKLSE